MRRIGRLYRLAETPVLKRRIGRLYKISGVERHGDKGKVEVKV